MPNSGWRPDEKRGYHPDTRKTGVCWGPGTGSG